jgi:hypothetical protein
MKTKTLPSKDRRAIALAGCPNFSRTGSIRGMKAKFYGKHAKLIRCGSWIYNCDSDAAKRLYESLP